MADHGDDLNRTFGTGPGGRTVTAYRLGNEVGTELTVLDLGATVQSLSVRDDRGDVTDVVLGFDDAAGYAADDNPYLGATVGRFANRIRGGEFALGGQRHVLSRNEGPTSLHGGVEGFHRRMWTVVELDPGRISLEFVSPDGDQGFPGELTARATYSLEGRSVWVEYSATTSAPTVVSLTNHAYFNLGGWPRGTVDDHELTVAADGYLPVDAAAIPLGAVEPVAGTPFDLTRGALLGPVTRHSHEQLRAVGGVDHAFVLSGAGFRDVARLAHPATGRTLEVATDQPSLQVYAGNRLDGTLVGKGGMTLRQGDGVCLETQGFPDAPNQPSFPSAELAPGETYSSRTRWTVRV